MNYNIVTNHAINQFFRTQSKYYKVNLGQSLTIEARSGDRVGNMNDKFSYVYNTHYKAQIFKQGSIGDITFYTDHEIREEVVALYIENEEFVHPVDFLLIREKGIDAFLGSILKKSQEEYDNIKKSEEEIVEGKVGNADQVTFNPGAVTYADLKAYMEKKNSERLQN